MDFTQIASLLVVAGVFGIVAKSLKQPLLVGYLFAGIVLGATGMVGESESIKGLGQIGVALLLFLLGLEMDLHELPTIGRVAFMTGVGQILITSTIGFLIALLLGFGTTASCYIAIALTFSSTIIMVKLLSEKRDLGSLYGKIAVGFLLVQDFVAVAILMFLSSLGGDGLSLSGYAMIVVKALFLVFMVWGLSRRILPYVFDKHIASSSELLFIVSIAWALGVAAFVAGPLGFTLEIGGFMAGLSLSNLPEHLQISSKTKPLRDFFLTIFFIILGTQLVIGQNVMQVLPKALIFSAFVLVGNPLIVLTIMGFLGYKKRTSFLAGLTVAQISEFSLIIVALGSGLGHVGQETVVTIILVGVITMTVSTYFILGSDRLYEILEKYLSIFERKVTHEGAFIQESGRRDHIVLIGCDRAGKRLLSYFTKKEQSVVVVDFDPKVFNRLTAENKTCIFGDIDDPDVMDAANISDAKLIVSTTSNMLDNLSLLEYIKLSNSQADTIFTAYERSDALKLYEAGATYVMVPDIVAGDHIKHIVSIYGLHGVRLRKAGKSHFNRLVYM